jgi:hypothetical protein
MTESGNSKRHSKLPQQGKRHAVADAKRGGWAMAAGKTAYREEFQLDYGPDRDEPLDGTESGREY